LTQTIPLPDGGGVFEALEAGVDLADFAGGAAGAGALEFAAGAGFEAVDADAGAGLGLALAVSDDAALVFLLRLFFAGVADESLVPGLLDESVDAVLVLSSVEVFFDRDFLAPVELSAVLVDAVEASLEAAFEDFEERAFLALPASVAEPEAAEVSVADDFELLDRFDLLAELPLLESEVSLAEESVAAAFFLDLLFEALELPEELSVAFASELAEAFLVFFLLVVLLLLLASDC
jgi:hypothetical protein